MFGYMASPEPTSTEIASPGPDEESLVREWRRSQFARLGFDQVGATLLADCGHVDLGLVRELVRGNCELDTAMRIVL